jgi:hypothetical protein
LDQALAAEVKVQIAKWRDLAGMRRIPARSMMTRMVRRHLWIIATRDLIQLGIPQNDEIVSHANLLLRLRADVGAVR